MGAQMWSPPDLLSPGETMKEKCMQMQERKWRQTMNAGAEDSHAKQESKMLLFQLSFFNLSYHVLHHRSCFKTSNADTGLPRLGLRMWPKRTPPTCWSCLNNGKLSVVFVIPSLRPYVSPLLRLSGIFVFKGIL